VGRGARSRLVSFSGLCRRAVLYPATPPYQLYDPVLHIAGIPFLPAEILFDDRALFIDEVGEREGEGRVLP